MVIWLIGMSGSGKTTLGREVAARLRRSAPNTVLLDGDEVRSVFAHEGQNAYTLEGRRINAQRLTSLCAMLDKQGIHVVCCVLSIFPEMQAANRGLFSAYFEVFMDAPLSVLEARDVKGLYAAARQGKARDVVGIDIPFPRPPRPDMVVDTSGACDTPIEQLAEAVLQRAGLLA